MGTGTPILFSQTCIFPVPTWPQRFVKHPHIILLSYDGHASYFRQLVGINITIYSNVAIQTAWITFNFLEGILTNPTHARK